MSFLYHTFFFNPIYNVLVLLFQILPWADAGVVVIILTILVRLVIYPLSRKAITTQIKMAEIAPAMKEIKEKYKDRQEEMARRTLELYRTSKVNPFSGIFVIFLQIPILIALYQIFLHADFPQIDLSVLYSFMSAPEHIDTAFLGLVEVTEKSLILALLAGVSAFIQFYLSSSAQTKNEGISFGDNLARSMQTQMKYFFPILIFFFARLSGVIALYFITTNVFMIVQERIVKRKMATVKA